MELLERGPVLLELSRLLAEADSGHGRLVFLGGEAGIGKTSLVRRFGELVADRTSLLIGGCDPLSTPRPLGPLLDIADRLPGVHISTGTAKAEIFRDLLDILSTTRKTLVLAFEDVHWADEATLDLLRYLARRIDTRRALLIATFRDDEVGDRHPLRQVLGDVATASGVRRLTLNPLSMASVRAMAVGTGLDVNELYRLTGGNAFFVTEVLATGGERIPSTVRDAVLARASRLPEPARTVLEAAAIIGFRCEPWLLEEIAGSDMAATQACLQSGILTTRDGIYEFRHELGRVAILETIVPPRRRELNRQAMESLLALEGVESDSSRLAHHADEAGDGDVVLKYAPEAARRSARLGAHREVIAQYQRALRYADRLDPDTRAELLEKYANECAATDRYDEAIEVARGLQHYWHQAGNQLREGLVLTFLSGCFMSVARMPESEEAIREGIALLEKCPPGTELGEGYVRMARVRLATRDHAEVVELAGKALNLSVQFDNLRLRILAQVRLGTAKLLDGDETGERLLVDTLAMTRKLGLHVETAGAWVGLGSGLLDTHEFVRAKPYIAESVAFAEEHQLEGLLLPALSWQSQLLMYTGEWSRVEESAQHVLNQHDATIVSRILTLVALGRLYARQGDSAAAGIMDEALELAEPTGMLRYLTPVRAMRAEGAWLDGNLAGVRAESRAVLELAMPARHPWLAGEAMFWLSQAGEKVNAPEWIAPPFAMQISGDWTGAAEEWARRGCPYEYAQALAGSGQVDTLRSALAQFDTLGARPAAGRTRRRLQRKGIRGIPRGPHASTKSNSAGLTRREVEISRLLSEGLSNNQIAERLFVSPKTVGHHVSRVLSKLGVRSRGQVAREATRLGILKDGEPISEK